MEAQPQAPEPKKSNKTLFIIGGILLACCCLAVVAIAVYQLVIMPKISNTFETINDTLQNTDLPSGGLAGDTLRRDVWLAVGVASSGLGCTPDAAQTTIEVIQDPDSSGKWIETWTVACSSGGQKDFDVTFTPTAGGGTDYSITTSP
jgi:hypothetical protein